MGFSRIYIWFSPDVIIFLTKYRDLTSIKQIYYFYYTMGVKQR